MKIFTAMEFLTGIKVAKPASTKFALNLTNSAATKQQVLPNYHSVKED
jgi:hypothetical protein